MILRTLFVLPAIALCASFSQQSAYAADSLVAPGGKVEKLADKFLFTEGPAADKEGNVYFSDIPTNRTLRWSTDGKLTTWRNDTGGANGLYFDAKGNLICCEGFARRLTSVSPDGKVTVLADSYDGKKLNSPNDLWVDPKGGIYFSDPRYGNMEGMEQKGFYVFYLPPGGKTLVRVVDDLVKSNVYVDLSRVKESVIFEPRPVDVKLLCRLHSDRGRVIEERRGALDV